MRALAVLVLSLFGCSSDDGAAEHPTPELVSISPATGEPVPRTAWLVLTFAGPVDPESIARFELACGDVEVGSTVTLLGAERVVVNPSAELPASTACRLSWRGPKGAEEATFTTAGQGTATVPYDRDDASTFLPFPDDTFTIDDAETRTGRRVSIPSLDRDIDVAGLVDTLAVYANRQDGFSALAHLVVPLSEAADPTSLPATPVASLDPLSTVALLELDGDTPGARVPFQVVVRNDEGASGPSPFLALFPVGVLRSGGRYGIVVSRRVLTPSRVGFGASPQMARALDPQAVPTGATDEGVRALASEVVELAGRASPPHLPDDIALALRFSVRTTEDAASDILAMRARIDLSDAPAHTIDAVTPGEEGGAIAAVVTGTWQSPSFARGRYVARDERGRPAPQGNVAQPFLLVLPRAALERSVPIVIYQHGQPGSANEVLRVTAPRFAELGYAVAAFTDPLNRAYPLAEGDDLGSWRGRLIGATLVSVLGTSEAPNDDGSLTTAEQLAFIRMIRTLAVDVLPLDAPDGRKDVDATGPLLYMGISQGARHGTRLLAYTPDILAAALVVGGGWNTAGTLHQAADGLFGAVAGIAPNITPAELWAGLALYQAMQDNGDPAIHASYLYRAPLDSGEAYRPASVLMLEGLGDSFVPNHTSEGTALTMGLTHVGPVWRETVIPARADAPLEANVAATTTGAYYQYVPVGIEGVEPTPSCADRDEREGHFCPQIATEATTQIARFFATALFDDAPTVIDPLAP